MTVLKKPVVTEKFTQLGEKHGQYGFIVDKKATKEQIKAEIEKLYEVNVAAVRTMVYAGKSKTRYTKRAFINGRTPAFKKAVVTLKEGQTIDFYANI
jgi:large subunit ribosomal protein L23